MNHVKLSKNTLTDAKKDAMQIIVALASSAPNSITLGKCAIIQEVWEAVKKIHAEIEE